MKIGIVHFYLATESGDPRLVFSLAQALKAEGHQVQIYTTEFDSQFFPELHKGLEIIEVKTPQSFRSLMGATSILGKIKERIYWSRLSKKLVKKVATRLDSDLDVLDLHNDASFRIAPLYRQKNPKAHILWTMHNPPFYHEKKGSLLATLLSRAYACKEFVIAKRKVRYIDGLITLDELRREMALKLKKPIRVLRIPVDFEKFYAPVRPYDKSHGPVTLLSMGSLSSFRRYEDTIQAVAHLKKKGHSAKAVLICKDFWKSGDYKQKLLDLVKKENLEDDVDFWFDGANEEELKKVREGSHAFIFPNIVNIWGMAAFEAMASGLPLVVVRVTSVAEVLKDGQNCLMVDPERPDQIADRVHDLISDPDLYRVIGQAGQDFVKEKLSWKAYAKSLVDFISNPQQNP